jgi:hypothetical protein
MQMWFLVFDVCFYVVFVMHWGVFNYCYIAIYNYKKIRKFHKKLIWDLLYK